MNSNAFGKKFANPVDGYVFAQPLYVPALPIPGHGNRNVVYVATENNSVYASMPTRRNPLWNVNLGVPAPLWTLPCKDIQPTVGITSTPAIDLGSNIMYVVARTLKGRTNYYYLHALDIASGTEKFGGPVEISATVSGTAEGNHEGKITFDPLLQLQRPGLVLAGGSIYIAFGSDCDFGLFHGWLFAYDAELWLKRICSFRLLTASTAEFGSPVPRQRSILMGTCTWLRETANSMRTSVDRIMATRF